MSAGYPKVPKHPQGPVTWDPSDIVTRDTDTTFWRIHKTRGSYPTAWHDYRDHGPLTHCRWDPQPEPVKNHPGISVLYAGYDLATCAAEIYQAAHRIDTATFAPYASSWKPVRPLNLLDLTGLWPLRAGASHALNSAPRSTCRNWARAIHEASVARDNELDGLEVMSTLTGAPCAVLFGSSASALPRLPAFTRPLTDAAVFSILDAFAQRLGWTIC